MRNKWKVGGTKRSNYVISIRSLFPSPKINTKFLSTRLNLTNRVQFRSPSFTSLSFFSLFFRILSSSSHQGKRKKEKRISSHPRLELSLDRRSPRKAAIPRALSRVRRAWEAAEWHKGARCGCRRFYLSPRAMHRDCVHARETRVALATPPPPTESNSKFTCASKAISRRDDFFRIKKGSWERIIPIPIIVSNKIWKIARFFQNIYL